MTAQRLDIVVLGLSITSSWGNGHATTYRGLVRALAADGHRVTFLERDVPWYAENRDLPDPGYCQTLLYRSVEEVRDAHASRVREADLVMLGSFVPDGIAVASWVQRTARGRLAFYDIDTPATLAALGRGDCTYLQPSQIPGFDLYLSFTGGPTLARLERELGARAARPLYCSFDPDQYHPAAERADDDHGTRAPQWDLGYMGTYSADRQPALEALLLAPARQAPSRRFAVAGPLYPAAVVWPANVQHFVHLAPSEHRAFYGGQRFTLNLTRADMVRAGYSPSVRLFEAAACAIPIISDVWAGLEAFFKPGEEILLARGPQDILRYLTLLDDAEARRIGERARRRAMAQHTAAHRARELAGYIAELGGRAAARAPGASAR